MKDDDMFDTDLDDEDIDDEDIDDELELDEEDDNLAELRSNADAKKRKSLEARRRIENIMELRRLREIDESIGLEDLEW